MNKVSAENLIEINQIIKNILYNDSEIDFELMKNYTNEIYCILNNINNKVIHDANSDINSLFGR